MTAQPDIHAAPKTTSHKLKTAAHVHSNWVHTSMQGYAASVWFADYTLTCNDKLSRKLIMVCSATSVVANEPLTWVMGQQRAFIKGLLTEAVD